MKFIASKNPDLLHILGAPRWKFIFLWKHLGYNFRKWLKFLTLFHASLILFIIMFYMYNAIHQHKKELINNVTSVVLIWKIWSSFTSNLPSVSTVYFHTFASSFGASWFFAVTWSHQLHTNIAHDESNVANLPSCSQRLCSFSICSSWNEKQSWMTRINQKFVFLSN